MRPAMSRNPRPRRARRGRPRRLPTCAPRAPAGRRRGGGEPGVAARQERARAFEGMGRDREELRRVGERPPAVAAERPPDLDAVQGDQVRGAQRGGQVGLHPREAEQIEDVGRSPCRDLALPDGERQGPLIPCEAADGDLGARQQGPVEREEMEGEVPLPARRRRTAPRQQTAGRGAAPLPAPRPAETQTSSRRRLMRAAGGSTGRKGRPRRARTGARTVDRLRASGWTRRGCGYSGVEPF